MKKDTLYEIYSLLKDDTTKITDSLYKLMLLNNSSEEAFLKFCKNNIIDEENFDYFINISECLNEIESSEIRNDLTNLIIDVASDDYIVNNDDYEYILESIIILLDFEYIKEFEMYEDYEIDYYKSSILSEYIRFLKNIRYVDMDKVYEHDMAEIIDSYRMMLGDLSNTTSTNNDISLNQMYLDRIKYFIDIISDKDIYEMDDDKFLSMLNVIKSTENIEELKYLKNIIKINRKKKAIDFINEIDNTATDVNELTIARITDEIGLKRKYDPEKEETIIKRSVNNPNKELNIVKKVLKPLD